jgi:hypothetical protein
MGQQHTKICEDLSNITDMIFNVKKLLTDDMELMLWQGGKKKASEGNEWQVLWI